MTSTPNYIYLIKEREFIKTGENILKIGKTKQESNSRIKSYPKGSELYLQMKCDNCDSMERELISVFKKKFILRKDIGDEYFEGDVSSMMTVIFDGIVRSKSKKEPVDSLVKPAEFLSKITDLDPEFQEFCHKVCEENDILTVYKETAKSASEDYGLRYPNTTKMMRSLGEKYCIFSGNAAGCRVPVIVVESHVKNKNEVIRDHVSAGCYLIVLLEDFV